MRKKDMNKMVDSVLPSAPVKSNEISGSVCHPTQRRNVQWLGGWHTAGGWVPWTVNRARACNLSVLTLPSPVRWSGVLIKMAHSLMAGYQDLELIEKRGHEFWTILYTFHYEVSSHSYKSIWLALKGSRICHSTICHFGKRIILS